MFEKNELTSTFPIFCSGLCYSIVDIHCWHHYSNVIRQYIGVHHKVWELLQSKPSLEQLPRSGQLFSFFQFRLHTIVPVKGPQRNEIWMGSGYRYVSQMWKGPSQSVFFIVDFEYNTCDAATNTYVTKLCKMCIHPFVK